MAPPQADLRAFAKRHGHAPCIPASPDARRARHRTAGCCRSVVGAVSLVLAPTATAADPTVASSTTPPARPDTGVVAAKRSPPERELTAADVDTAPLPGQEGGQLQPDPGDSALRVVGRGILFVPKLAIELVLSPVHG